MRKNRLFILGIFTVMVALVSLSLVSGTWAKYTSSISASGTARVAKWDVKYNSTSGAATETTIDFDLFKTIVDTVDGNPDDEVAAERLAPGTKGSFKFTIKNDSEVDANYSIDFELPSALQALPLKWEVTISRNGTDDPTLNSFPTNVTMPLASEPHNFDMGTEITYTISWEWPFDGVDADDTKHGIAAVSGTTSIRIVFVQVD